jgi:hypothetical protein
MMDEDQKPDQRVAEFKLLAETAQRMADKAENESARADYLKIAKDWLQLAERASPERRSSDLS